ncbi:TonB-dependent receptor [Sphingobium sp. SCG-1]|nr:TonB-dependent receptor [Sphingobium sp. SCG-1]
MALSSVAGFVLVAGGMAQAQDTVSAAGQDQALMGDIIVTAQKRSERLSDVPISINAASGDQLKSMGVSSTDDLQKLVPGFTFQKTVYGLPVYFIRGVGFNDTTLGVSPAVSVYVDQQPLPFSPMARGATLDLERVEVLKGPQGTLFGQNSTGGAVNYIAAKPTPQLQAGFDLSYGRFNQVNAEGYISGPITDTLRMRVALRNEYQDDWQKGYTARQSNGKRRFYTGRVSLDWDAADTVRVALTVTGWRDHSDSQQSQLTQYTALVPAPMGRPLPFPIETFPTAPRNSRAAAWDPNLDLSQDNYFYQFAGRIEADLSDDVMLTSLTSYAKYKQDIPIDLDSTTYSSGVSRDFGNIRSFSQEMRLSGDAGKIKWMVGGNYQNDRVIENLLFDPLITSGTGVGPFTFDTTYVDNDQKISSKSAFGSLDYAITEQLTVQGSIRYTDQDRDFAGCVRDAGNGQLSAALAFLSTIVTGQAATIPAGVCATLSPGYVPLPIVTNSLNQDNLSWRVSANYKPNSDTLLYANVTKGYKAGSFPTLPSGTSVALTPISQESVLAYEVGTKLSLLSRKIQITAAAFYYDYRDKQLVGYIIDPVFGTLPSLVPIPKTRVTGGEFSIVARPMDGLTLSANSTYLSTRIQQNPATPIGPFGNVTDFKGQSFPYTPKWQGFLDAQYDFALSSGLTAFVGGNVAGRTRTTAVLLSNAPAFADQEALLRIPGYKLLDLRTGFAAADESWRVEFWGRNVTNKFYVISATRNSDFTTRYTGMPVTYGVTFRYRFGAK